MTETHEPILVERDGTTATVVLNNPAWRNAMTLAAFERLTQVMTELDADTDLRCIVVRGAGDAAFAAGADIAEFPDVRADAAQAYDYTIVTGRALEALQHCRHPVVAMIQGACTGGGLEIAACCDIRIAARSARFGVPIKRIGHAFAPPEMKPVLDLVGRAAVLELLLEGAIIDAEAALAKGLVNRVVVDADLAAEVAATVDRISEGAPLGARMTKRFVNRFMDPAPLTDAELRESFEPCDADDYREGYTAFLEKRTPVFKGR